LWNASIAGMTHARNLPLGPELEKVEKEVQRHRIFVQLGEEIVAVNEQICQLRPVPVVDDENELEQLKKQLRMHFAAKRTKK